MISFCSAFGGCFDCWSVCFCFLFSVMTLDVVLVVVIGFGVLLYHCDAAIGLFLNEELCLFHHKSCVLIWNVLFLLLF